MSQASLAKGFSIHVVDAKAKHTHTAIILHGRGSNGDEFSEELFESTVSQGLGLQDRFPSWRWVFPTARERYSTVFQEEMDEWFDIYSLTDPSKKAELQREGLAESITFVKEVIAQELQLVSSDRLVLGGISQGCATGLHALMSGQHELAGFVGFCGWLPLRAELETMATKIASADKSELRTYLDQFYHSNLDLANPESASENTSGSSSSALRTPIYLSHSADDEVVDINLGEEARNALQKLGMAVTWKSYSDGGHWLQEPEGVLDLCSFLQSRVLGQKF